jgi:hypothetical protein
MEPTPTETNTVLIIVLIAIVAALFGMFGDADIISF